MPPTDRSRARLAAYALLAVIASLALIPGYLAVPPPWRPPAVRLACGLVLVIGCTRIIGSVRRSTDAAPRSPLDAPAPAPVRPALDERFIRVRDDIVFGHRSRRYFDTIVWPRLRALAATGLTPPAGRRVFRRLGPPLRTLEHLIAEVERRP